MLRLKAPDSPRAGTTPRRRARRPDLPPRLFHLLRSQTGCFRYNGPAALDTTWRGKSAAEEAWNNGVIARRLREERSAFGGEGMSDSLLPPSSVIRDRRIGDLYALPGRELIRSVSAGPSRPSARCGHGRRRRSCRGPIQKNRLVLEERAGSLVERGIEAHGGTRQAAAAAGIFESLPMDLARNADVSPNPVTRNDFKLLITLSFFRQIWGIALRRPTVRSRSSPRNYWVFLSCTAAAKRFESKRFAFRRRFFRP